MNSREMEVMDCIVTLASFDKIATLHLFLGNVDKVSEPSELFGRILDQVAACVGFHFLDTPIVSFGLAVNGIPQCLTKLLAGRMPANPDEARKQSIGWVVEHIRPRKSRKGGHSNGKK